jgi:lysophospholipase L1-like esterase
MKSISTTLRTLAVGALAASIALAPQLSGMSSGTQTTAGVRSESAASALDGSSRWVNSWASMPQLTEPGNMPPAPFTNGELVFADSTVRTTVRSSIGGRRMRLRFSNAFGGVALPITKVSVALPLDGAAGVSAITPGTSRAITFGGQPSVVIPVGAQMVSDPINFDLKPLTNLAVTIYLAEGQASANITSHPGSRTTSYMLAGDHVQDADLAGAASVAHWYFLSGIEVTTKTRTKVTALLGDSLTDGRGSITNANNRWPDQLLDRLHASPRTADIAILNQAAGGNRVLNDGLGPNALARLDRDILAQSGVTSMIVFEGVNDIGTAEATEAAQQRVSAELIRAYDQIIVRAHAQGISVYGATITPFGGNTNYDDPDGFREAARQAVNRWIRTSHHFDAVIDFDAVVRDPAAPRQMQAALEDPDHLHMNPTGYRALADAVPANLLQR